MKGQWLMLGGAALFLVSWAAHDIFKIFASGWEATALSLFIFISPLIALLGIVIFLLSRVRQRKPPQV
ncbi:MAG: hypothetical protein ACYDHZ_10250 [Dehalococcoidia bacterium]|jgi:hypothetical protein